MCDFGLTAMAVAPMAMMAGSTAMGVAGAISQGNAQKRMAEYESQVARNNAEIASRNEVKAYKAGAMEAQQQRTKMATLLGSQRAGYGASGVDVNTGSAREVQKSSQSLGYQDLLTIRENTRAKANAFRQQGTDYLNRANMALMGGANAQMAGYMGAATSFLDGASSMYLSGVKQGYWGTQSK